MKDLWLQLVSDYDLIAKLFTALNSVSVSTEREHYLLLKTTIHVHSYCVTKMRNYQPFVADGFEAGLREWGVWKEFLSFTNIGNKKIGKGAKRHKPDRGRNEL